mgnify:CR=1 FL=1
MAVNSVILFIISQKLYKTPYNLKMALSVLAFFCSLMGVGYYLKTFEEITMIQAILIKVALVLIYGIVLVKLNVVDISKLKKGKHA